MDTNSYDHRDLQKAGFFAFDARAGKGLPLWLPKASLVREKIEGYWRDEHRKRGYDIIYSPHIGRVGLWETTQHWMHFRDRMFGPLVPPHNAPEKEDTFLVRPMNCPFHMLAFNALAPEYHQLPIRLAELGTVYRLERHGELKYGLIRVRGFTQDDSHIFCRPDQVLGEVTAGLRFAIDMLHLFGFSDQDFNLRLCVKPPAGSPLNHDKWRWGQQILNDAVKQVEIGGSLDYSERESLFYGTKLDIEIKDNSGLAWVCSTFQIDLLLPELMGISYVNNHGEAVAPIMIHRTLLGSMERFFALLMEHHAGALPVWLAPVQVAIIPVSAEHDLDYAQHVKEVLIHAGLRADVHAHNKALAWKIRNASEDPLKYPYIVVVGAKERQDVSVSVRLRSGDDCGSRGLAEFAQWVRLIDETRSLSLVLT